MADLDDFDRRILRALQQDPQISMEKLAAKIGLSHTPCWRRVRNLEKSGVIRGRSVVLDREALGFGVMVLVQIRLKQHDEQTLNAFEKSVRQQPEILDCYTVAGDHDYFLRVTCVDPKSYERLLKEKLLHLPGVGSVNSHFALNEVKHTDALPL